MSFLSSVSEPLEWALISTRKASRRFTHLQLKSETPSWPTCHLLLQMYSVFSQHGSLHQKEHAPRAKWWALAAMLSVPDMGLPSTQPLKVEWRGSSARCKLWWLHSWLFSHRCLWMSHPSSGRQVLPKPCFVLRCITEDTPSSSENLTFLLLLKLKHGV